MSNYEYSHIVNFFQTYIGTELFTLSGLYPLGTTLRDPLGDEEEDEAPPVRQIAAVLVGGGMDGFTTAMLLRQFTFEHDIRLVHVNYGQATFEDEAAAIHHQALVLNVAVDTIKLSPLMNNKLATGDGEKGSGNVCNRNALLSMHVANYYGDALGMIALGSTGDSANPDNTLGFMQSLQKTVSLGAGRNILVYAPFAHLSKYMVVIANKAVAQAMRDMPRFKTVTTSQPDDVATLTTSCFYPSKISVGVAEDGNKKRAHKALKGSSPHCGECSSCIALREAYKKANEPFRFYVDPDRMVMPVKSKPSPDVEDTNDLNTLLPPQVEPVANPKKGKGKPKPPQPTNEDDDWDD